MIAYTRFLVLGLLLLGTSACPSEGMNKFKNVMDIDCTSDVECASASAVCDVTGGTCVQCLLPDKTATCTGATPVCGGDKMCHACTAHSDCLSDACLPGGACALESEVVYVKQGGTFPGGACSKGTPCGSLDTAIGQAATTTKPYIRIIGALSNVSVIIAEKQLVLLGEKDTTGSTLSGLQLGGGAEPTLLTLGTNAKVELHNVNLVNADGAGVKVDGAGASLLMSRSKVTGADEEGILISNGVVTISDSEISACGGTGGGARKGINLNSGQLTMSGSTITDNGGGGIIVANDQKFSIANSFIVSNRGTGGLQSPKPGIGSKFEFNTVADNRDEAGNGVTDTGGIFCDDSAFTFPHNIIFRNLGGNGGFVQVGGSCKYEGSYLSPNNQADGTSLGFFKDTLPRDYHLTTNSPATVRDVAGVTCTGTTDIDGEARPQGVACDLGADELKVTP